MFLIGVGLVDVPGCGASWTPGDRSSGWRCSPPPVVVVGVEQAILVAMALSLISHTRHGYRPQNTVLVPGARRAGVPHPLATDAQAAPGLVIYRFTHSLYYANLRSSRTRPARAHPRPPARWLCVDAPRSTTWTITAETIRLVHAMLKARGIRRSWGRSCRTLRVIHATS